MGRTLKIIEFESQTPVGPVPFRALIEDDVIYFYDKRHMFSEHGQFTGGSYYLDTFMEHQGALNLYGGEPSWYLDSEIVAEIQLAL